MNLGKDTATLANAMIQLNPDKTWAPVQKAGRDREQLRDGGWPA
jgi:hypothetical protein